MKRMHKILDIVYKKLSKKDWDNLYIIAADEGRGKSNLLLWIFEYWLTLKYGSVKPEHIKYVALDRLQFVEALKDAIKFDCIGYDEAGDISNKRVMGKFNFLLTQAYQVIRGDNLFTILVLPNLFDLDPFFTKRRAKGFIQVYERGKFAFWSKDRLRMVIALNQSKYIKTPWVIKPSFFDTFPKYHGALLDPYMEKKANKMKNVRSELYKSVKDMEENGIFYQRNKLVGVMHNKLGTKETAKAFGMSERNVQVIMQEIRKTQDANI
jgi:hypothetical protein